MNRFLLLFFLFSYGIGSDKNLLQRYKPVDISSYDKIKESPRFPSWHNAKNNSFHPLNRRRLEEEEASDKFFAQHGLNFKTEHDEKHLSFALAMQHHQLLIKIRESSSLFPKKSSFNQAKKNKQKEYVIVDVFQENLCEVEIDNVEGW